MAGRYDKKIEELKKSAIKLIDMAATYEQKAAEYRFDAEVENKMAEFLEKFENSH